MKEEVSIVAGWTGILSSTDRPSPNAPIQNNNLGKMIHYMDMKERSVMLEEKATREFWEGRLQASLAVQRGSRDGKESKGKADGKRK